MPHIVVPHGKQISAGLFHGLEYASLLLGAFGGALASRRDRNYQYDVVGVLGLGLISGVGGGVARDILLGDGPPLALQHPIYLALALLGAALAVLFGSIVGPRMNTVMLVIDAAGLGLFTTAGASRALAHDLGFLPCLLLGIATAVGGGSLRDVFSGRAPQIFTAGELYAAVAAIAAFLFLVLVHGGMPLNAAATTASVAGFALRMLAVKFHWRTSEVEVLE